MMFVTSLRQSNLFPTTKIAFDSSRQLVWSDVVWRPQYINLRVKWGKAQQKTSTRFQRIPRADGSTLCLAVALSSIRPARQRGSDPIFAFPDKSPIPISFAAKAWTAALAAVGMEDIGFTMHSLRRGGARYLQDMGVNDGDIASHAGWKSKAMYDYIHKPALKPAYRALKSLS